MIQFILKPIKELLLLLWGGGGDTSCSVFTGQLLQQRLISS